MFVAALDAGQRCLQAGDCRAPSDGGAATCETNTELLADGGIRFALDGRCRAVPNLGEHCPLPDSDCGQGRFCSPRQTCQLRASLGAPCVAAPCDDATYCDQSQTPPRCALRKVSYQPCNVDRECQAKATCDATLSACIEGNPLSPLDVEFTFCLGSSNNRIARQLSFVPADGGL